MRDTSGINSLYLFMVIGLLLAIITVSCAKKYVSAGPVTPDGPWRLLYSKELNDLERKAEGGDIDAIRCLYEYYVFKDSEKAVVLARKGAKLGDAALTHLLGITLVTFEDSKGNAEGITALKTAADQNYSSAQTALADCYQFGKGVPKNLLEAENWFRKAAMQGDRIAMVDVVRLLTRRASDISILSEAYGWTFLILKRTPSWVSQAFIDNVRVWQQRISFKAEGFGIDERTLISRAEEWARKEDVNIPMTEPVVGWPPCKYFDMRR